MLGLSDELYAPFCEHPEVYRLAAVCSAHCDVEMLRRRIWGLLIPMSQCAELPAEILSTLISFMLSLAKESRIFPIELNSLASEASFEKPPQPLGSTEVSALN